jgi:hypothetical protein
MGQVGPHPDQSAEKGFLSYPFLHISFYHFHELSIPFYNRLFHLPCQLPFNVDCLPQHPHIHHSVPIHGFFISVYV